MPFAANTMKSSIGSPVVQSLNQSNAIEELNHETHGAALPQPKENVDCRFLK
jgi:hypothetical protein